MLGAPKISTDGFLPDQNAIRDAFNGRASHGMQKFDQPALRESEWKGAHLCGCHPQQRPRQRRHVRAWRGRLRSGLGWRGGIRRSTNLRTATQD